MIEVLRAADDAQVAVRQHLAHVAGAEVAVGGELLARLLRHAPVAGEDVRALDLDAADAAGAQGAPSASTMRTDTPGSGGPTVPAMRSPSSGFDVFIPVSVMP